MLTKTEQLNELFTEWKENLYKNTNFSRDGINNEELYHAAKHKILFIAKEPNNSHDSTWDDKSYQEWWQEKLYRSFSLRIAEWSYGLLNDFHPFKEITEDKRKDAIHTIAFMNIKKSGVKDITNVSILNKGDGSRSDYSKLLDLVQEPNHRKYIIKQINIIEPEIIITSFATWLDLSDKLFSEYKINWEESDYNIRIGKFNSTKVIDFYHPSAYIPPAASYSLLQNVVSSKQFKNL